jgi:hypothetical protein
VHPATLRRRAAIDEMSLARRTDAAATRRPAHVVWGGVRLQVFCIRNSDRVAFTDRRVRSSVESESFKPTELATLAGRRGANRGDRKPLSGGDVNGLAWSDYRCNGCRACGRGRARLRRREVS